MADQRIKKLAQILTGYSIRIKKGYVIKIVFGMPARELALECYKEVLRKGAIPIIQVVVPGFSYAYLKNAKESQLKAKPNIALYEARNTDGIINIITEENTKELSNIDPKKISIRSRTIRPVSDIYMKKDNWVGVMYPTQALAQDAEMSLEEFEDFFFGATNIDWKKESMKMRKLKRIIDNGKIVRIKGEDTDISFDITGRIGEISDGKRNMPSGEVFTSPIKTRVNGKIRFSFPTVKFGKEIEGIQLEFRKGKVINAKAQKNEDLLKTILDTDKGSRYIGEFGIGTNFGIKNYTREIAFDEKIGGTIHLALGAAFEKCGGKNKSAIHWDIIKDLRKGGEIIIDGKVIQRNGRFTFKM